MMGAPEPAAEAPANPQDNAYAWHVVGVLMIAYTVAFIDRQIITLLIEPIKRDLVINDTQISLLTGFAFAIFFTVMGVPMARLADRMNRKLLISAGLFFWSLMTAFCGLANSFALLFIARVGVGVGEATITPAAMSIIADYFSPKRLARAIGVYVIGLYLGAGLAVLTGSVVIRFASGANALEAPFIGTIQPWQLTFFIVALLGAPTLVLMATVREPKRREFEHLSTVGAAEAPASMKDVIEFVASQRRVLAAHFAGFGLLGTVISAYLAWTPELLRRTHDVAIADAGLIFGVVLIVFGVAGPLAAGAFTPWLRTKGFVDAEMRASLYAGVCMTPFVILTPLSPNLVTAVISLCAAMFFLSSPQGLAPAILQLIAPNRMRAQVTAIFMLVAVLAGYSIGPLSVAALTDYVFKDEQALRYSLSIVSGVLTPLGVLSLSIGLRDFRRIMAQKEPAAA